METGTVDKVYLHSRIASTIVDVACVYLLNRHVDWDKVKLACEKQDARSKGKGDCEYTRLIFFNPDYKRRFFRTEKPVNREL